MHKEKQKSQTQICTHIYADMQTHKHKQTHSFANQHTYVWPWKHRYRQTENHNEKIYTCKIKLSDRKKYIHIQICKYTPTHIHLLNLFCAHIGTGKARPIHIQKKKHT